MKNYFLICCAVFVACNNSNTTTTSTDSTSTAPSEIVQTDTAAAIETPSCYAHQTSNNIVLLKLNMVRPSVTGRLTYDIMGKDKNEGTISGTMRGDTLYADYTFMSEGKRSVRQVAFLRQGDAFIEGYADIEQRGDTMLFSKTDTLNFNGTMILKQIPCTNH
jgi:hypothetical protein